MSLRARMFARDLAACLALGDERKSENAAWRARCKANEELCSLLLERALRRGERAIDWPGYFRGIGISE